MLYTKVVKASSSGVFENKINEVLRDINDNNLVDIKISGSYNGNNETFIAVIIAKH